MLQYLQTQIIELPLTEKTALPITLPPAHISQNNHSLLKKNTEKTALPITLPPAHISQNNYSLLKKNTERTALPITLPPAHISQNNYSLLKKNIEALHIIQSKTASFNLSTQLTTERQIDSQALSLHPSKEGIPYATYMRRPIHSKYAPSKESLQVKNYLERKTFDCIVIFGMGLGYIPDMIYAHYPNTHIIIVELHTPLILALLSNIDYSKNDSLKNALKNIDIFINPSVQTLISYLHNYNISKTIFIHTQVAKVCFDDTLIQTIKKEIYLYENKMQINFNSLKKYKYRWPKNILENINTEIPLYVVDSLKGIHKDTPALLCAAGPSFESYIDMLDELYEKMLIVCVDTALPILRKKGVVPDYIVVADPQFINTMHLQYSLQWAISKGSRLIIDILTSSRVLRLIKQYTPVSTVVYVNIPSLCFAKKLCASISTAPIQSGGSVATFALDICNRIGSRLIYTLGLDLSYPNKQSHYKETYFEKRSALQSNRLHPIGGQSIARFMSTPTHIPIKTYEKKYIHTDILLNEYRIWIETYIDNHHHLDIRTLSSNIGKIQGIQYSPYHNIQSLLHIRKKIEQQKQSHFHNQIHKKYPLHKYQLNKQRLQHTIMSIMTQMLHINTEIEAVSQILLAQKNISIDTIRGSINRILIMESMDIVQGLYPSEIPKHISPKHISKHTISNNHHQNKHQNKYQYFQDTIDTIKKSLQTFISLLQPYTK